METTIEKKVIDYLTKHPAPKDEKQFHKFAETVAKEHGIAEETAYKILGSFLSGGKSKGKKEKVDPKELAMGIKVEMEHTPDKLIAEKIARDHLFEFPDYYTRLKKMEKEAESDLKKATDELTKALTGDAKVKKVMGEFKRGELHSGSKKGPIVRSRAQAQAIALSEAGKSKYMIEDEEIEDEEEEEKKEKPLKKAFMKIYNNVYLDLSKARVTKYIKRIPKPSGKGFYYFYTQKQVKDYKEKGIVPEQKEKKGVLSGIMSFFGLKNEKQANEKVNSLYNDNKSKLTGVDKSTFTDYMNEYLSNKEKWDSKFSTKEKKESSEKKEKKPSEPKGKSSVMSPSGKKWNMGLMKTVAGIVSGGVGKTKDENFKSLNKKSLKEIEKDISPSMIKHVDISIKNSIDYHNGDIDEAIKMLKRTIENNSFENDPSGLRLQVYSIKKMEEMKKEKSTDNFGTMPEGKGGYSQWLESQPEAKKEINEIIERSKDIKDEKNRKNFIKREKQDFETKWTKKFSERNKNEKNIKTNEIKIGDKVITSKGDGIIKKIDNTTYSIPMYVVDIPGKGEIAISDVKPKDDKNAVTSQMRIEKNKFGKYEVIGAPSQYSIEGGKPSFKTKQNAEEFIKRVEEDKNKDEKTSSFTSEKKDKNKPWTYTKKEWVEQGIENAKKQLVGTNYSSVNEKSVRHSLEKQHEQSIKDRLRYDKKPVPEEVLKDYPELSQPDKTSVTSESNISGRDLIRSASKLKDSGGGKTNNLEWVVNDKTGEIEAFHAVTGSPWGTVNLNNGNIVPFKTGKENDLKKIYDEIVDFSKSDNDRQKVENLMNYPIKNKDEINEIAIKNKGKAWADKIIEQNQSDKREITSQKEENNVTKKDSDELSSNRLKILENSLEKKKKSFDEKLQNHFDTVKQAHGQPLNDKGEKGRRTLNTWEKQKDSLRKIQDEIKKTENAIEKEKYKISNVEEAKSGLPKELLNSIESGSIIQWRKHPNTFFVKGVDKARMVWDPKQNVLAYRYLGQIKDPEQRKIFARTYNELYNKIKENQNNNPMQKAAQLLLSELQKAKKAPIGTVSGKYKKVAEGKWVPVKEGEKSKKEQPKPEEKGKKEDKKDKKKEPMSEENRGIIKNTLKRVASILADALSMRDVTQTTGSATEQTGEEIRPKKKPTATKSNDEKKKPDNKEQEKK